MVEKIVNFIKYWYFRYLLVTELYMVEKWERVMIHIVLLMILGLISFINVSVILALISLVTTSLFPEDNFAQNGILNGANQAIHSEF